jgi:hypothetical protein
MTLDEFFEDRTESRALFDALDALVLSVGPVELRVTKSQVAFQRRHAFAWAWTPDRYLGHGAPLVLTVGLRRRDESPRWKQVVEPSPGLFTHHLEIHAADELDEEVRGWVREAWDDAG